MQSPSSRRHLGFTIVELLVVVAIISLLIAILLPAIGKAKEGALVTQSVANLNNLGKANATYGSDWQDRQFTAIPDDFGGAPALGNCTTYQAQVACLPQQIAGWDAGGGLWGFWIAGPLCPAGFPGNCGNIPVYLPNEWGYANGCFGSWRLCNYKAFNDYVNGRYYDKVFWAPNDKYNLDDAQPALAYPGEFCPPAQTGGASIRSTYVWSPAAMWAPDVLSSTVAEAPNAGKPNQCGPGAYRSPAASLATYPDLKTRMIERIWLQNTEGGALNSGFAPPSPWLFNQGYNSAPACLYFDGHVSLTGVSDAMEADARAKGQNQANANIHATAKGLWHRGTPLGGDGSAYYSNQAYDMLVNSAFHVLTTDGIQGRDVTGAK